MSFIRTFTNVLKKVAKPHTVVGKFVRSEGSEKAVKVIGGVQDTAQAAVLAYLGASAIKDVFKKENENNETELTELGGLDNKPLSPVTAKLENKNLLSGLIDNSKLDDMIKNSGLLEKVNLTPEKYEEYGGVQAVRDLIGGATLQIEETAIKSKENSALLPLAVAASAIFFLK